MKQVQSSHGGPSARPAQHDFWTLGAQHLDAGLQQPDCGAQQLGSSGSQHLSSAQFPAHLLSELQLQLPPLQHLQSFPQSQFSQHFFSSSGRLHVHVSQQRPRTPQAQ